MNAYESSGKMKIFAIATAVISIIAGFIIVDGDWYWLRYATIFGGKEKASELDTASLVVTGKTAGASEWVKWGDKAAIGLGVMLLGIVLMIILWIVAIRLKKMEAIQSILEARTPNETIPLRSKSSYDRLVELKRMLDDGIITESEYQNKRKEIVNDL